MPNRIVRESILTSERVSSLGWPEEVFYRRLMSIVDDYGRHEANLQLLRSRCYPLQTDQVRVADISRWIAACEKAGLVVLYAFNSGANSSRRIAAREMAGLSAAEKVYVQIENFGQQQRSASKCPPPPSLDISCEQVISDAHLDVSVSEDVSVRPTASSAGPPTLPCPYERIVELYRIRLPDLPGVKLMEDDRKTAMRKFWGWVLSSTKSDGTRRATTAEEALAWIDSYFERAGENDWLMGRLEREGKHANWRADFDFLLTPKGRKHVIEKTRDAA